MVRQGIKHLAGKRRLYRCWVLDDLDVVIHHVTGCKV